jgi:predicted DNA-binding protein (UPF0251 family)
MRLVIEARVESADAATQQEPIRLAVIERVDDDLEVLGLSLQEGRELMAAAQSVGISMHVQRWLITQASAAVVTTLCHKDRRSLIVPTIFGKVSIQSPRFWGCRCGQRFDAPCHTISPLADALRCRITPELEYLQVKWAAHLPYATSTRLLKEVLPLQNCISTTGAKTRIRSVGSEIDRRIEREISGLRAPSPAASTCESPQVTAVGVDSAWLKH